MRISGEKKPSREVIINDPFSELFVRGDGRADTGDGISGLLSAIPDHR
jgi:hypothetical protein